MKSNRNDFDDITNEIESLIEALIQYVRQHDSTSPRFVGVCNDFLR